MRIASIFEKDISRPINGVVKADQLDEQSVWQELEEFVVTRELDGHFHQFFDSFCEALDNPNDSSISGRIGIWISGFFGSGKSHLIKVLSYLLENEPHSYKGETRKAIEFFESKIADPLLYGNIKKTVASDTDVILFNIDNKADAGAGRHAILTVLLKVLNERQGYSYEYPHIAHLERYLDRKGRLTEFHEAYANHSGTSWLEERDVYHFHRDNVLAALAQTLGQSTESCISWVDSAENDFKLSPENFVKWVKEFLDRKGANHRLVFLADEVGQFIARDSQLMLNMQTITEELGTKCEGRAWIVVTSQEDMDAVLGNLVSDKPMDFSKIQGRFHTRLSLSSNNVDEVIQGRLLEKTTKASEKLAGEFEQYGDILKNQLTFRDIGTTYAHYTDAEDFAALYPFAPYQFKLLQRIFESIRKAGATGLHLAQGERSLLDAFQVAAKSLMDRDIGALSPLYLFYPAIESFLDTSVKRTIDQANDNPSLQEFDGKILQILFMIRYVDEMKGNVDNLVTLCIDEIDADRLSLKQEIELSLERLEHQTLVSRSGDSYLFLTNEERDINREVKSLDLAASEEARLLGELVYEDVLLGHRKHRFKANKMDFAFNRQCDFQPIGNKQDGALFVSVVTPLADEYDLYNSAKCISESTNENGQVLVKLNDHETLGRDIRDYLKTQKYLRSTDDNAATPTTRRILRDMAERREGLTATVSELIADAEYFVSGQSFDPNGSNPQSVLDNSLDHLIRNTFSKMSLLSHPHPEPLQKMYDQITSSSTWRAIAVAQRASASPDVVMNARTLGHELFAEMGPDSEESLYFFLKTKLTNLREEFGEYQSVASSGHYPGTEEITDAIGTLDTTLAPDESSVFLNRFLENSTSLKDLNDEYHDIANFFKTQKATWDKLIDAKDHFEPNRSELERHNDAATALTRIAEILSAKAPYSLIRESDGLIERVNTVNDRLLGQTRTVTRKAVSDAVAQYVAEAASSNPEVKDRPVIRQVEIVTPSHLTSQSYLESNDDVEDFLRALRKTLNDAIVAGKRIEIR